MTGYIETGDDPDDADVWEHYRNLDDDPIRAAAGLDGPVSGPVSDAIEALDRKHPSDRDLLCEHHSHRAIAAAADDSYGMRERAIVIAFAEEMTTWQPGYWRELLQKGHGAEV